MLDRRADFPWLVGREPELRELHELWSAARRGRGSFVVVSGDAGIGKSRLVERVCHEIAAADDRTGGRVVWGSCSSADMPAFWPWRCALHELGVDDLPVDAGSSTIGLLDDPRAERTRVQVAIIERLRSAAEASPLVVVLDDLHWADPDSIAIVRLLVGQLRRLPLLCIATMRPGEQTATDSGLRSTIAELASSIAMLHLGGLADAAVGELIGQIVGEEPSPGLVTAVTSRADGNPLFVRELVRLLSVEGRLGHDDGSEIGLPPLVRDVLLRRCDRMPSRSRRLLDVAAVAGRSISLTAVAIATGESLDAVVPALTLPQDEHLVSVSDGVLAFEHDLVREALVDALDPDDRRWIHRAVAAALTRVGGPASGHNEIAAHLVAAVPVVAPEEAAAAALAAGRESLGRHAPSDAVVQIERGLAVLGDAPTHLFLDLQLALGDALASLGEGGSSQHAYERAISAARSLGDADGFARAALGSAGRIARPRTDPRLVQLLEEALVGRDGSEDPLTAHLTARLAQAMLFSRDVERRNRLADDAVALARRIGDQDALAGALYVWILVHQMAGNFEARLARAEELVDVGRSSGSADVEAAALHLHAHHMAEVGDLGAFDADVAAYGALATRARSATWMWTNLAHRAMRATMQGDFAEGERLGEEAFRLGTSSQHDVAGAVFGSHLMALRTWQGRLGEHLDAVVRFAGMYRELPAAQASVPYIRAEIGDLNGARDDLEHMVLGREVDDLPGAHSWTVAVAMFARAAHLTGSADLADQLLDLIAAQGERHVVGPFGDCYFGPALVYLALCSVTVGDHDAAISQLTRGIELANAAGSTPVVAWATAELCVLLRSRGDPVAAARHRQSAAAELGRLGMVRHLDRLDEAWAAATDTTCSFKRLDSVWRIEFDDTAVELRDMKGIADLHRLVATPDVEIHVLDLMEPGAAPLPNARQPVLDERAKAEYRARLGELDTDIEEFTRSADTVRAERARTERDQLLDELRAAVGLAGRDRAMVDEAERARQAVRARIRYALDHIETVHPNLARHLRRSVTTGMFCAYRPERPTTWAT